MKWKRFMVKSLVVCPALCKGFATGRGRIFPSAPEINFVRLGRSFAMVSSELLTDKVYLVTGSTDGIGRHTASRLGEQGSKVLVHGRKPSAVRDAIKFVKEQSDGKAEVDGFVADISTLQGMHQFCDEILARTDRLDCLINNAGAFEADFRHTDDGLEYTFAVNVLAPYVITGRLLDLIAQTPGGGRVINVASLSASSSVDFNNLQFEKGGYSDHASYSLSKLLDIMFNAELARRAPTGVTCNALDPGTVDTKMLRAGWGMGGLPVNRANDEYFLATSATVSTTTGRYFVSQRMYTPPTPARNESGCRRLWGVLEELSGFSYA